MHKIIGQEVTSKLFVHKTVGLMRMVEKKSEMVDDYQHLIMEKLRPRC